MMNLYSIFLLGAATARTAGSFSSSWSWTGLSGNDTSVHAVVAASCFSRSDAVCMVSSVSAYSTIATDITCVNSNATGWTSGSGLQRVAAVSVDLNGLLSWSTEAIRLCSNASHTVIIGGSDGISDLSSVSIALGSDGGPIVRPVTIGAGPAPGPTRHAAGVALNRCGGGASGASCLLTFGGYFNSALSNATWVLPLPIYPNGSVWSGASGQALYGSWGTPSSPAQAWQQVEPVSWDGTPGPQARHSHSLTPSVDGSSALLFGGLGSTGPLADLWSLQANGYRDVSVGRPATMSSSVVGLPLSVAASFAVDGDRTGVHDGSPPSRTRALPPGQQDGALPVHSCAMSAPATPSLASMQPGLDALPWWSVDVTGPDGSPTPFHGATLLGQTDGPGAQGAGLQTQGFVLAVTNNTGDISSLAASDIVICYADTLLQGLPFNGHGFTVQCAQTAKRVIVALPFADHAAAPSTAGGAMALALGVDALSTLSAAATASPPRVRQLRLCQVTVWQDLPWVWTRLSGRTHGELQWPIVPGQASAADNTWELLDLTQAVVSSSGSSDLGHGYPWRVVDGNTKAGAGPAVGSLPAGEAALNGNTPAVTPWTAGTAPGGCWESMSSTDRTNGAWVQIDLGERQAVTQVTLFLVNTTAATAVGQDYSVELYGAKSMQDSGRANALRNCSLPSPVTAGWASGGQTAPDESLAVVAKNCAAEGVRYVVVRRVNPSGNVVLPLCEVRVHALPAAWPAARCGHAAASLRGQLVVFGGYGSSGQVLGDAHAYDMATGVWRALVGAGSTISSPSSRSIVLQGLSWPVPRAYASLFSLHDGEGSTKLMLVGGETATSAPLDPALAGLPFSMRTGSGPGQGTSKVQEVARLDLPNCAPVPAALSSQTYAGLKSLECNNALSACHFTCAAGYSPAATTLQNDGRSPSPDSTTWSTLSSVGTADMQHVSVCGLDGSWSAPAPFCLPDASTATASVSVAFTGAGSAQVDVVLPTVLTGAMQAQAASLRVRVRSVDAGLPDGLHLSPSSSSAGPDYIVETFDRPMSIRPLPQLPVSGLAGAGAANYSNMWPVSLGYGVRSVTSTSQALIRVYGGSAHLSTRGTDGFVAGVVLPLPPAVQQASSSWAGETLMHEAITTAATMFAVYDWAGQDVTWPKAVNLTGDRTGLRPGLAPSRSPALLMKVTHPSSRSRIEVYYCPSGVTCTLTPSLPGYVRACPWDLWAGWSMRGAPPASTVPYPDAPRLDLQSMHLRWERDGATRTWTPMYRMSPSGAWTPACGPVSDSQLTNGTMTVPVVAALVGDASNGMPVGATAAVDYMAILPVTPGRPGYPTLSRPMPSSEGVSPVVTLGGTGYTGQGKAGQPLRVSVDGIIGASGIYTRRFVVEVASVVPGCGAIDCTEEAAGQGTGPWRVIGLGPSGTGAAIPEPPPPSTPAPLMNLLAAKGLSISTTVLQPPFTSPASTVLFADGITRPADSTAEATLCPIIKDFTRPPLLDLMVPTGWFAKVINVSVWTTNASVTSSPVLWDPQNWHWVGGPRSEPNQWMSNGECAPPPYPALTSSTDYSAGVPCPMRVRHLRLRPRDQASYISVPMQVCEEVALGPGTCAPKYTPPGAVLTGGTVPANCTDGPIFGSQCSMGCGAGMTLAAGVLTARCSSPPYWSDPQPVCAPVCPPLRTPKGVACLRRVFHQDFSNAAGHGGRPHASFWSTSVGWHDASEGLGAWSFSQEGLTSPGSAHAATATTDIPGGKSGTMLYLTDASATASTSPGTGKDVVLTARLTVHGADGAAGIILRAISDDVRLVVAVQPSTGTFLVFAALPISSSNTLTQTRVVLAQGRLPGDVRVGTQFELAVADSASQASIIVLANGVEVGRVPHSALSAPSTTGQEEWPLPFGSSSPSGISVGQYSNGQGTVHFHSFTVHRPCLGTASNPASGNPWYMPPTQSVLVDTATHGHAVQLLCPLGEVPTGPTVRSCTANSDGLTAVWNADVDGTWGCAVPPPNEYPQTGDPTSARPLLMPDVPGIAHADNVTVSVGGAPCPLVTAQGVLITDVAAYIRSSPYSPVSNLYCAVPAGQGVQQVTVTVTAAGAVTLLSPRMRPNSTGLVDSMARPAIMAGFGLITASDPGGLSSSVDSTRPRLFVAYSRPVITRLEGYSPSYADGSTPGVPAGQITGYSWVPWTFDTAVLGSGQHLRVYGRNLGTAPALRLGPTAYPDVVLTVTSVRQCGPAGSAPPLSDCFELDVPAGEGDGSHADPGLCPPGYFSPPGSSVCYAMVASKTALSGTGAARFNRPCAAANPSSTAAAYRNPAESAYVIKGACGSSTGAWTAGLGLGPEGAPPGGFSAVNDRYYIGLMDFAREAGNDKTRNWAFEGTPNASAAYALSTDGGRVWCPGEPNQAGDEDVGLIGLTPATGSVFGCLNDAPQTYASVLVCCEAPALVPDVAAGPVAALTVTAVTGSTTSDPFPVRYQRPVITSVTPLNGGINGTGRVVAGWPVLISGYGFGSPLGLSHPGLQSAVLVAIGQRTPPMGATQPAWSVSSSDDSIATAGAMGWSYDPSTSGPAPAHGFQEGWQGAWTGTSSIDSSGKRALYDPNGYIGPWYWTWSRNATRLNDTHITAEMPSGTGGWGPDVPVRVYISGQWSNALGGGMAPWSKTDQNNVPSAGFGVSYARPRIGLGSSSSGTASADVLLDLIAAGAVPPGTHATDVNVLLTATSTAISPSGTISFVNQTAITLRGGQFGPSPIRHLQEATYQLGPQAAAPAAVPLPACVYLRWWRARSSHGPDNCTCSGADEFLGEGEVHVNSLVSWADDTIIFNVPHVAGLREVHLCVGGQMTDPSSSSRVFVLPVAPALDGLSSEILSPEQEADGLVPRTTVTGRYWPPMADVASAAGMTGLPALPTVDPATGFFDRPVNSTLAFMLPTATLVVQFGPTACFRAPIGAVGFESAAGVGPEAALCSPVLQELPYDRNGVRQARFVPPMSPVSLNVTVKVVDGPLVLTSVNSLPSAPLPPRITGLRPNPILITRDVLGLAGDDGSMCGVSTGGWASIAASGVVDAAMAVLSGVRIELTGVHLGALPAGPDVGGSSLSVIVSGQDGPVACINPRRLSLETGSSVIECTIPAMTAGPMNITLTAGAYTTTLRWDAPAAAVVGCGPGLFGVEGARCSSCPRGAACPGYSGATRQHRLPVALPGWYDLASPPAASTSIVNGSTVLSQPWSPTACPPGMQGGAGSVCVAPCEPAEACAPGGNQCAPGYESRPPYYRCGECASGYYRRSGSCVQCPTAAPLRAVVLMGVVIASCAGVVILGRHAASSAFPASLSSVLVSGVDSAQALAVLGTLRLTWPASVRGLLSSFGATTLNAEILAPECLWDSKSNALPSAVEALRSRFGSSLGLPLLLLGLLAALHVLALGYETLCIRRQWRDKHGLRKHFPLMLRTCLVLLSFVYLPVCLAVISAVDCVPTSPPDGQLYLRGTFEACGSNSDTQRSLALVAAAAVAVYVIGIPAVCTALLAWNRLGIQKDQMLRLYGSGTSKLTNAHGLLMRTALGALYSRYVPDKPYWQLVLLARRAALVGSVLAFNFVPSGQTAAILLVVLVALLAHITARPMLGVDNRLGVIKAHLMRTGNVASMATTAAGRVGGSSSSSGKATAVMAPPGSDASLRAFLLELEDKVRKRKGVSNSSVEGDRALHDADAPVVSARSLSQHRSSSASWEVETVQSGHAIGVTASGEGRAAIGTAARHDRLDVRGWDKLASGASDDVPPSRTTSSRARACASSCVAIMPCARHPDVYGSRNWLWTLHGLLGPNTVETVLLCAVLLVCLLGLMMDTTGPEPEYATLRDVIGAGIYTIVVAGASYWAIAVVFQAVAPDPLLQPAAYHASAGLFKHGLGPAVEVVYRLVSSPTKLLQVIRNSGEVEAEVYSQTRGPGAKTTGAQASSEAAEVHTEAPVSPRDLTVNPLLESSQAAQARLHSDANDTATEVQPGMESTTVAGLRLDVAQALLSQPDSGLMLRAAQDGLAEAAQTAAPPTSAEWHTLRSSLAIVLAKLHIMEQAGPGQSGRHASTVVSMPSASGRGHSGDTTHGTGLGGQSFRTAYIPTRKA